MTEIDTSKEMIQLSVEALRKIANDQQMHAPESWDDSDCISCAADLLDALLFERDALRKAVDSYSYIGRDGKMVLAKDLEDERDALRAQLQAARDEALEEGRNAVSASCFALPGNSSSASYNAGVRDSLAVLRAIKSTSAESEGAA